MVEAGVLTPVGKTRGRVYYPTADLGPDEGPAEEQLPLLPE